MPRVPRIYIENAICYITSRGDHDEVIFKEEGDYNMYLELLKKARDQYKFRLYAYCLLPNHAHLLVEPEDESAISQTMHSLNSNYTKYFNGKYSRSGHLFQERYKMVLIEKIPNIANIIAYINNNPKILGLVSDLKEYAYSSHRSYLYYDSGVRQPGETQLLDISKDVIEACKYLGGRRYEDFMSMVSIEALKDLGKDLSKKAIIGSDDFINKVKDKVESEKIKSENLSKAMTVGQIAGNKKFIAVSGAILALLISSTLYLYARTVIFKANLKAKDKEFSSKFMQAREEVKKDLNEKYRADMVSFGAMAKRLEAEKARAAELEKKIQGEEAIEKR